MAEHKLSSFDEITSFLEDVAKRFLEGDLNEDGERIFDAGDVKAAVQLAIAARDTVSDKARYQEALERLLKLQKDALGTRQRITAEDGPIHGDPFAAFPQLGGLPAPLM